MPTVVAMYALLAVAVIIAIAVVSLSAHLRKGYADDRARLDRLIRAVERFQGLQPEFLEYLRRVESDANALQKIALQIETAVAMLQEAVNSSINGAAERQSRATEGLLDHIDLQEERLAKTLESLSESLRNVQPEQSTVRQHREDVDHSRLRKEVLRQGPEIRFSVLKQWIDVNALAIAHRASRGWTTPNDLIANIPAYLEPEAEVLHDSVLVIGTRDHCERLAISLRPLDPTSEFNEWFDPALNGHSMSPVPATVMRSAGHFTLLSKGTHSATGLPAA